jgi:hypothetical protein
MEHVTDSLFAQYGFDAHLAKSGSLIEPYGGSIRNPYKSIDRPDPGSSKEFLDGEQHNLIVIQELRFRKKISTAVAACRRLCKCCECNCG